MTTLLYENALQVVPLLLIALFLDRRIASTGTTARAFRVQRWSNKFSLTLNAMAFLVSLFIVAGVLQATSFTLAVVVAAVAGSIGLLCGQIWQRIDQEPAPRPTDLHEERP